MNVKKYKKKPVIIEAIQFLGGNVSAKEIQKWVLDCSNNTEKITYNKVFDYLSVFTKNGIMIAHGGAYIIRGIKGEFYPCIEEIFNETYELVENE